MTTLEKREQAVTNAEAKQQLHGATSRTLKKLACVDVRSVSRITRLVLVVVIILYYAIRGSTIKNIQKQKTTK